MRHRFSCSNLLIAAVLAVLAVDVRAAEEVNVYSNRPAELLQPLLDGFTKQTGIATNLLFLDQGLVERMRSEGEYSPADIIVTVDDSRLTEAKQSGLTQAVTDGTLAAAVPANFRDPEGHWFGLTLRPRVLYVARARVDQTAMTYEGLSEPRWKGRICIRDSRHASNIGLIAAMIESHGETYTEKWLLGLKANLARKPKGNDRSQAEAVAAGTCDIALGNTEYMAAMIADPEQKDVASRIRVVLPNSADRGTSVGVSGMAMASYAPHRANALLLMQYLAGKPAQALYSRQTNEFPVNADAEPAAILKSFGPMKPEDLAMDRIVRLRGQALGLVERVQFNEGPSQ